MPRPRTVANEEILAAVAAVIGEVGPHRLTLARVARRVGLAPATLVQRFGSRRDLLLALADAGGAEDPGVVGERLHARHGSPLAAARAFLLGFSRMARTPEELANHLAFLQMDVTDPDFREMTQRVLTANEDTLTSLLDEARSQGELRDVEPRTLARSLLALVHGALVSWAIYREGEAAGWVEAHLAPVLDPHLGTGRGSA